MHVHPRSHPHRMARTVLVMALAAALLASPAAAQPSSAQPASAQPASAQPASAQPAVTPPTGVLQPWLADQLDTAAADQLLFVFVHAADAARLGDALAAIDATGMSRHSTWDRIGVAIAIGTPAQIRAAGEEPGVVYLEGNQPLEYYMDTSHIATRSELARDTLTDAGGNAIDGTGVSIGIVDSGVDGTHPMFQLPDGTSKVRRNLEINPACNFVNPLPPPNSPTNTACLVDNPSNNTDTARAGGHGTHVAGTAGGVDVVTSDGRELRGAAPGATLISLSTGGAIAVLGANHGLNWILENHENPCAGNLTQPAVTTCPPIRSTNHSYGPIGGGEFNPASATSRLQNALVAEGIVSNWAAGNDGGNGSADMVSPNAKNPTPGVIGVASYDDGNSGTRQGVTSTFSSRGLDGDIADYPDISAPGTDITSACRPTLAICQSFESDLNYGTISGTSMATPHLAGIVAQLFQADPMLTPAQVEDILEDTAHQFTAGAAYEPDLPSRNDDHTTSFDKGHGLVDVARALASVLGVAVPPPLEEEITCVPGQPQITDPRGDATAILGVPVLPVNQAALDVLSAELTAAPAAADPNTFDVTFTITVDDLPEMPGGTTGEGEHFDFNFSYGGASYFLTMTRTELEGESFVLGDFGGANGLRRTLATGLEGRFDAVADTISAVLPAGTIAGAVAGAPVIADGALFSGLKVIARYSLVFLVPDADTASSSCPFVVGSGVDPGDPLQLTIGDVTTDEGDTGPTDFVFDVMLSGAATEPVTVDFASADGTATAGPDYVATSGDVTFAPGETSQQVTVTVNGDTVDEDDETFTVNLSEAMGAVILDGVGTGTIVDDDGPPTIDIGDVTVTEPETGTTDAVFTVTLSEAATSTVSADFVTADGSAVAPGDYTTTTGTVTFPIGSTSEQIRVPVQADDVTEDPETFTVTLSNAQGGAIGRGTGTGTINDEGDVRLTVDDPSVAEGDEGTTPLGFTITASAVSTTDVTVDFATADGTATIADVDYQAFNGKATIAAGSRSVLVPVQVVGDTVAESDETFDLRLSGSEGATITDDTGEGTIDDDDTEEPALPTMSINDVTAAEGNTGTTPFTFEVTLSDPSDSQVTVSYQTAPGTATASTDFTPTSGTLIFAAGETMKTITVDVLGDTVVEPDETFTVGLTSPMGATIADSIGVGTIRNDDQGPDPDPDPDPAPGDPDPEPAPGDPDPEPAPGDPDPEPAPGDPDPEPAPGDPDPAPAPESDQVRRVAGTGRIETATALSLDAFPAGAPTAVLARADDFPDALAAVTLAAEVGGPLLLTSSDALSAPTAAELQRLGTETVYLVGGESALAPAVATDAGALGAAVIRVGGLDRFSTAALIAREVVDLGGPVDGVILARGDGFADALAAGSLAAGDRRPILLTGTADMPAVTSAALSDVMPGVHVLVAGGTAAVGEGPAQAVRNGGHVVDRAAGTTRYHTAVLLAEAAVAAGGDRNPTFVASGADFPDALAAAPAAHAAGGVLVLVDPTDLDASPEVRDWFITHLEEIDSVVIAGGTAAVVEAVARAIAEAIIDGG